MKIAIMLMVMMIMVSCKSYSSEEFIKALNDRNVQVCAKVDVNGHGSWPTYSHLGVVRGYVSSGGMELATCMRQLEGKF